MVIYIDTDDHLNMGGDLYNYLGPIKMVTTDDGKIIVWTMDNNFIDVSNDEIRVIDVGIDGIVDFVYDGYFSDELYLVFADGHLEHRYYHRDGTNQGNYDDLPVAFDEPIVRIKKSGLSIWAITYDGSVCEFYKQQGIAKFNKRYDGSESKFGPATDIVSTPGTLLILTEEHQVLIKGDLNVIGREGKVEHFTLISDLHDIVAIDYLHSANYPIISMLISIDSSGKFYFSGYIGNDVLPFGADHRTLPSPTRMGAVNRYPITQFAGDFSPIQQIRIIRDTVQLVNDKSQLWVSEAGEKFIQVPTATPVQALLDTPPVQRYYQTKSSAF